MVNENMPLIGSKIGLSARPGMSSSMASRESTKSSRLKGITAGVTLAISWGTMSSAFTRIGSFW